tara:strand:- start:8938 stop:9477 length:540 start_codon:yes stop_codon:yes gene_type:complete
MTNLFLIQKLVISVLVSSFCWQAYAQEPPPPPPPPPAPPGVEGEPVAGEGGESVDADFELFLEPYNYDPSGRRDPFLKITDLQTLPQAIRTGGQQRPLLPLERYELKDIRLIGIIWDTQNPRAMFMDPTNQVHILTKDQRIGRNQGYIAVIRESELVVVETTEKNGEPIYTTKVIRIQK